MTIEGCIWVDEMDALFWVCPVDRGDHRTKHCIEGGDEIVQLESFGLLEVGPVANFVEFMMARLPVVEGCEITAVGVNVEVRWVTSLIDLEVRSARFIDDLLKGRSDVVEQVKSVDLLVSCIDQLIACSRKVLFDPQDTSVEDVNEPEIVAADRERSDISILRVGPGINLILLAILKKISHYCT